MVDFNYVLDDDVLSYTPFKKIIMLGEAESGNTNLLFNLCCKAFYDRYRPTIGSDFLFNDTGTLQYWDTAGREDFQSLNYRFYHQTDAVIYCVDLSKRLAVVATSSVCGAGLGIFAGIKTHHGLSNKTQFVHYFSEEVRAECCIS